MRHAIVLIGFVTCAAICEAQVTQVVEEKITLRDIYAEESAKKEASLATKRFHLTAAQSLEWEEAAKRRRALNAPYLKALERSHSPEEEQALRVQLRRNLDGFYLDIAGQLTPLQQQELDLEKSAHHEVRKSGRSEPEGHTETAAE